MKNAKKCGLGRENRLRSSRERASERVLCRGRQRGARILTYLYQAKAEGEGRSQWRARSAFPERGSVGDLACAVGRRANLNNFQRSALGFIDREYSDVELLRKQSPRAPNLNAFYQVISDDDITECTKEAFFCSVVCANISICG